ncbi:hypothetical protein ACFOYW_04180 [Gryllotalpicola reticulitermitis]|uniref:Nucleotide exchange factor GrpE n=1 Tax=Gryllotalpicola reticulitermitis TaxID=1184153 RepID=A0ABV8Q560_9MICO
MTDKQHDDNTSSNDETKQNTQGVPSGEANSEEADTASGGAPDDSGDQA